MRILSASVTVATEFDAVTSSEICERAKNASCEEDHISIRTERHIEVVQICNYSAFHEVCKGPAKNIMATSNASYA